jgi:anti-sigma regulatory factor (Ser/Thr protein kinase)
MGDSIRLAAEPRSVGRARRFCAATLGGWGVEAELVDTCVLLVSELATNAVLHARTPFVVEISADPVLRIEVHDLDPRMPQLRDYGIESASGRGMHLVEALSVSSGAERNGSGKAVWFEVSWSGSLTR